MAAYFRVLIYAARKEKPTQTYKSFLDRKREEYGSKFDTGNLASKFVPYYENQHRIEVKMSCGTIKRGRIGVTTGWRPSFLLMLTVRSIGSSWALANNDQIIKTITEAK